MASITLKMLSKRKKGNMLVSSTHNKYKNIGKRKAVDKQVSALKSSLL